MQARAAAADGGAPRLAGRLVADVVEGECLASHRDLAAPGARSSDAGGETLAQLALVGRAHAHNYTDGVAALRRLLHGCSVQGLHVVL